jgi:GNAT superfamily N-acetyltransferase
MKPAIHYRTMQPEDIATGLQLCRASRWNQVERDWELFLQCSPDGCRVAVQGPAVVGTVTTVNYQARFSWIGMVLVDAAMRGQGIGTQLLREALAVIGADGCARLDATPAGFPVYHKLGFVEEYCLSRMEGVPASRQWLHEAQPLQPADLAELGAWDEAVFGADRSALLTWLLAGAPELCWVVRRAGKLRGYVLGRCGHNFIHIGPLIAEEDATAQQLAIACFNQAGDAPLVLDVPQQQTGWLSWLTELGFHEQRPFIRMRRGMLHHPGQVASQFAIVGPEFG